MKTTIKKTAFLLAMLLCTIIGLAQVPQGFSYQAVIRNSSGTPLGEQNVKIHVLLTNSLGTIVHYEEVHTLTTTKQGVASLTIGEGTLKVGTLAAVPWKSGDIYLKVEVDPTGSSGYQALGTPVKFYSVPYALYANNTKEVVSQLDAPEEEPIFVVKNKLGQIVFAVYQTGVRVYVADTTAVKGAKGGFAIGGLTSKGISETQDYFSITPSSARIWFNDTGKGAKGGFAVGGLTGQGKATVSSEYLSITSDSSRFYIKDLAKGAKGGFAVGGLTGQGKAAPKNFLSISPDSTRIYVSNQALSNSSSLGGFSIKSSENTKADYFNVSALAAARKIVNESRVMWYPARSALLAGDITVLHPDSVGLSSMALGYQNIARGDYSQAMGYRSIARGTNSTAIGYEAIAGENAFSFGNGSKALGLGSFAFGAKGVDANGVIQDISTEATGAFSFAFGLGSKAKAIGSFVLGVNCESSAKFAIATGFNTKATGPNATAMGLNTEASGANSFASGSGSIASGLNSTAMGVTNTSSGTSSFTLGSGNEATNTYSFAIGSNNKAYGTASVALGLSNTTGILGNSTAGYTAFAAGSSNTASGDNSIAAGTLNISSGVASVAFGRQNTASGNRSFAIGNLTTSSNVNSVAMGQQTIANADNSMAIGYQTNTTGASSLAMGENTQAIGVSSFAAGYQVKAQHYASFVIGRYNTSIAGSATAWQSSEPLFVAGNGNSTVSNDALVLFKNGDLKVDGSVYPNDNGVPNLGSASNRWNTVYAVNTTISTSDIRLKKNISDIGYGLSEILKLRPVSFIWKDNEQQGVKLGLIAQEVKPIISEAVDIGEDKDKTLGISYSTLIPVLIKSIQEQQQIIEEQKQKNEQLEKLLLELSKKIELVEQKLK